MLTAAVAMLTLLPPPAGVIHGGNLEKTMPAYFSGTGCRVFATTKTYGSQIVYASLKANGQLMAEQYPELGDPPVYTISVGFSMMFDSSHFPNGQVTFELYSVTESGADETVTATSTIVNKAAIYGRHEWDAVPTAPTAGACATNIRLTGTNYQRTLHVEEGWTASQAMDDIANCTVFYVNTHGNAAPYSFESDVHDPPLFPNLVFARDIDGTPSVAARRMQVMGTGLPPYNSTGKPPISIVLIDSCDTGQANPFTSFLYPMTNFYRNPIVENQAYLGWRSLSDADRAYTFAFAFWGSLVNGNSVRNARLDGFKAYSGDEFMTHEDADGEIAIYGDSHTRLRSVYTGTSDGQATAVWKRSL